MMDSNSLSTNLVIGLAAFGLALVAAGVRVYRRRGEGKEDALPPGASPTEADSSGDDLTSSDNPAPERRSDRKTSSNTTRPNLPLVYFGLVFALTIPFWLFGGKPLPVPVKLPISSLSLVIPLIAAVILTYRRDGTTGVKGLFKKVWDFRKIKNKAWYLPILFLFPLIAVLSYGVMRLSGRVLPDPQIPWKMAPVYLFVFFIAGIGEELGWMGFIFDPMQDRWGALKASLLLGLVWAIYHLIPDLQNQQPADWILWHRLGTVAFRVLMAWVYNNTGKSLFAVILFHAANNLGWALFPNNGSHYDPLINFLLTLPVVVLVVIGWESNTLARFRFAGRRKAMA